MNILKNFFKEMKQMLSSDGSNYLSSKRVITFLAFCLVSIAFIANMICNIIVDKDMFDGMIQIVWAGLGVVVGEHLLKKKNESPSKSDNSDEEEENELGDN